MLGLRCRYPALGPCRGCPKPRVLKAGRLLQILELGRHGERGRITEEEVSSDLGSGELGSGVDLKASPCLGPSAAAAARDPGAAGVRRAVRAREGPGVEDAA